MARSWLLLVFLCACDEPAPAPVVVPSAEPPLDLAGFCQNVCGRAEKCGLEAVRDRAGTGRPSDREALAEAEREAPAGRERCVERCQEDTPTKIRDVALFQKSQKCLAESSCDRLLACLDESAKLRAPN